MSRADVQIGSRVVADDRPNDPGTVVAIDGRAIFIDTDEGFGLVRSAEHLRPAEVAA